jgi:hypothetical protein
MLFILNFRVRDASDYIQIITILRVSSNSLILKRF